MSNIEMVLASHHQQHSCRLNDTCRNVRNIKNMNSDCFGDSCKYRSIYNNKRIYMVKNDREVVTLSSADETLNVVLQMEEMDIKALYEKLELEGTHFITGWNARIFIRTPKGVLVLVPQ